MKTLGLITVISTCFASIAAIAAWAAAIWTRKAVFAQIIIQLSNEYSSEEMLAGMRNLIDLKEKYGEDFAKIFGERRNVAYSDVTPEINRLDQDRRRYSHYFAKIWQLSNLGIINTKIVKKIIFPFQVQFLLEVIEPLEEAINKDYDRSYFEYFRNVYPQQGSIHFNVKFGRKNRNRKST